MNSFLNSVSFDSFGGRKNERKMDIDSLIASVKAKMGELIQKPKMIDKLLQKPPFRFLHDTITAITNTTGFGEGLYAGEELDSAAITDRQAKVNYLEKIFNLVGICQVCNRIVNSAADRKKLWNFEKL